MAMPSWAVPMAAPAPDYEQLLAQTKMKLMNAPPVEQQRQRPPMPGPSSWAEAGVLGAGDLPPGLAEAVDRLPPDMRERFMEAWDSRGGGGRNAGGQVDAGGAPASGGASGPWGPNWGKAALGLGMVNPFAGLAAEGARRGSNISYANSQRDMLGIEQPGAWGDFWGGVGKGKSTASIGNVDIGAGPTAVSYGGILDSGRTSYTPEEARKRQLSQLARNPWDRGGPDVGGGAGGGGGWGESGSFAGREGGWDDDRGYGVG